MKPFRRSSRGLSLVEMSVSLVILTIITLGLARFYMLMESAWNRQTRMLNVMQGLRWGQTFIRQELQHSSLTASPGWARVSIQGGGDRMNFGVDTDDDQSPDERVWYWLGDGGPDGELYTLYRGAGMGFGTARGGAQELLTGVVANPSGEPMFELVGGVLEVELTARHAPGLPAGTNNQDITLWAQIRPRN